MTDVTRPASPHSTARLSSARHAHVVRRRVLPPIVGALLALVVVLGATVAVGVAADLKPVVVEASAQPADQAAAAVINGELDQPPLPIPSAVPEDPYEEVPISPIGSIDIPKIGLSHTMYSGVWLTVLDQGPGHWPGTAEPGGWGNAVIAGHRVTNSRPFRNVDQLAVGDEIILNDDAGSHVYSVTGTEIVQPSALRIVEQQPGRTVTLFACHPPGSAAQRIVVYGELVSSDGAAPAA